MNNKKPNILDITSVLVQINGPIDTEVSNTAKFTPKEYKGLLEKLYQDGIRYDFSAVDQNIAIDALRIFLEGISDGDVEAVTGHDKEYFLDLYGSLLKEWNIPVPKLKRQSYDSIEYQAKATSSGLVEKLEC